AVAQHLAPAELALVSVGGQIALHLRDQGGIAQPHAVACRGTIQVRIVAPLDPAAHGFSSAWPKPREATASRNRAWFAREIGPSPSPLPPRTTFAPANATSGTVRLSPGSKRTAVPAGMSSRLPYARPRSNTSARFVSAKGSWLPTWIGRSPRFTTFNTPASRPAFSSISPEAASTSPGTGSSRAAEHADGAGAGSKLPD